MWGPITPLQFTVMFNSKETSFIYLLPPLWTIFLFLSQISPSWFSSQTLSLLPVRFLCSLSRYCSLKAMVPDWDVWGNQKLLPHFLAIIQTQAYTGKCTLKHTLGGNQNHSRQSEITEGQRGALEMPRFPLRLTEDRSGELQFKRGNCERVT